MKFHFHPDAVEEFAEAVSNTRRCLLNRFPFALIYQVKSDTILIIAVSNLHQRPGYWKGRT